ncbi:MAG: ATP-dependent RNA helicase HrpA, partial [Gammaproteobacteria bacterium]|nr:ATP-dependent RNA helicase HrpA [Gammaproteobacteria bacterium]
KLARMLLQAKNENALSEVLIIVSALATQDPRERPLDKQQAADGKHAVFIDKASDFIFYINLWHAYHVEKKSLSGNQLRKWCKKNFISWMRMREWIDTHKQIKKMLSSLKMALNTTSASYEQIHQSLLIGLLANIGCKDEGKIFSGARNKKFNVFPGSALFKSPPKWLMAGEIVETAKIYSRTNAKIDIGWVEEKATHLLKYHYSNPHWEKKRSQVIAHQQSTLYGLIINADKKIDYGKISPLEAKEIFIRCALIAGDFESKAAFYLHNRTLVEELEALEAKSRRRDIIVDENILYDFYQQHLPDDVFSGARLDKWLRNHSEQAKRLYLTTDDLMRDDATLVSDSMFPDTLDMSGSRFPIEYHFDPSNHCDGITLVTPVAGLNMINTQRCEWLIPGLLQEKIIALIKSLPKHLRKNFVPAPNFAEACVQALEPSNAAITAELTSHLKKMTGVQIPHDAWNTKSIGQHLLMNFRVIDGNKNVLAEGRDLSLIKNQLVNNALDTPLNDDIEEQEDSYKQDNVGPDVLDDLAESLDINVQGINIKMYPALQKKGNQVNKVALDCKATAAQETHNALRQLFINALFVQIKDIKKSIPDINNLCLKYADFGRCDDIKNDIVSKAIDEVFLYDEIKTENEFNARLEKGKSELHACVKKQSQLLMDVLDAYRAVKKLIKNPSLTQLDTVSDIQLQLNTLLPENFVTVIPQQWLQQYPRYLSAIAKRFDKAKTNAKRDRQLRIVFSNEWQKYVTQDAALKKQHIDSQQLEYYRWMLEEYRVSLFAQELKTRFPVSEKRIKTYWDTLD